MNIAILRIEKVKSLDGIARLNHYHTHRENHPYLTHPDESKNNKSIDTGYRNEDHLVTRWKKRIGDIIPRSNAVYALDVLLTFTPGAENSIPLQEWVEKNKLWLAKTFGGIENVIGLFLHLDQTTPHLHAIIVPLHEGRLNASYYVGDKFILSSLQDDYADAMKTFNLGRGSSFRQSDSEEKVRHSSCKNWYKNEENENKI